MKIGEKGNRVNTGFGMHAISSCRLHDSYNISVKIDDNQLYYSSNRLLSLHGVHKRGIQTTGGSQKPLSFHEPEFPPQRETAPDDCDENRPFPEVGPRFQSHPETLGIGKRMDGEIDKLLFRNGGFETAEDQSGNYGEDKGQEADVGEVDR